MMGAMAYCSTEKKCATIADVSKTMEIAEGLMRKELRSVISMVVHGAGASSIPAFNDDDSTDQQDVIDVFNFIATLP